MHGSGEMKYADGSTYIGEWTDGFKDGKGKHTHADGEYFNGTWQKDKKVHGKESYANGDTYVGSFKIDSIG